MQLLPLGRSNRMLESLPVLFRNALEQSDLENAQLLLKYGAYIPNDRMSDTMNFIQNKIDNTQNEEEKEKWTNMKQNTLGFCFLHLLKENNPEHINDFINTYSNDPINVNVQNRYNDTPLIVAVASGNQEAVEFLFNRGANMYASDGKGYNPMTTAVKEGNAAMVDFIYQKKPLTLTMSDGNGYNPMTTAVKEGNAAMVDFIYQKKPVSLIVSDRNGYNPMTTAVKEGNAVMVDFIYQKKPVSLIVSDRNGYNPMTTAVKEGKADMVDFIYQKEPFISIRLPDGNGYTPMTTAVKERRADMVDFIYQKKPVSLIVSDRNGYNPMTTAVKEKNADMVEFIYQKEPTSINVPDKNGYTPMTTALSDGSVNMVRLLCNKGANPWIFKCDGDRIITTEDFIIEQITREEGLRDIRELSRWRTIGRILDTAKENYNVNGEEHAMRANLGNAMENRAAGRRNGLMGVNPDPQVQGNRVVENPENPRGNENEANHRAGGINGLIGVHPEGHQGGENQRHDGNGLGVVGRDPMAQQPPAVQGAGDQGNQRGNVNNMGG